MSVPRHHQLRAAHVVAVAAVFAVLAAAASCGPDRTSPHPAGTARTGAPSPVSTPSPTPVPPLTRDQALDQIARYVKINNEANRAAINGDTKKAKALNRTIETGALRQQSIAGFDEMKVMTAKDKAGAKPFYYTRSTVYIPREYPSGQTPYFYAITHDEKYLTLLVFVKSGDGIWKIAAASWMDQAPPPIAVDEQGDALAVDPDASGLAMRPALLSEAIQDNYSTGGQFAGKNLAATKDTKYDRTWVSEWNKDLRPAGRADVISGGGLPGATYALRTVGGGALVVSGRKFVANFSGQPTAQGMGHITIFKHDYARAWVHHSITPLLSDTYTCVDVGAIPPEGAGRLARQIGEDCQLTGAQG